MSKAVNEKHTLCVPITSVEDFAKPAEAFDRRFYIMNTIHNEIVTEANRRLNRLFDDRQYRVLRQKYHRAVEQGNNDRAKQIGAQLNKKLPAYELTKYAYYYWVKPIAHKYKQDISSTQVRRECDRVWAATSAVLFGKGKTVHYSRLSDLTSISQKTPTNGIKFDIHIGKGIWNGIRFSAPIDWDDPYIAESLAYGGICYYEIKRMMFKSDWRYCLVIVMDGAPPKKINDIERNTDAVGGVDPGTSTIAFYSDEKALLRNLASNTRQYEKCIRHLQKQEDHIRRVLNPENFNEDSTAKKGRRIWKTSKHLQSLRREIRALYRKRSAYIKQCHNEISNEIIRHCGTLIIEPTSFTALPRRTKKTERSDKVSVVKGKHVHKYRRKKRYGHSISEHAPALMIMALKQKAAKYGIAVKEINPYTFRASQYNPVTGEYHKSSISERTKTIGDHPVQRDLLSAYLIAHPDSELKHPDTAACLHEFNHFLTLHDAEIAYMKSHHMSSPSCFGF